MDMSEHAADTAELFSKIACYCLRGTQAHHPKADFTSVSPVSRVTSWRQKIMQSRN